MNEWNSADQQPEFITDERNEDICQIILTLELSPNFTIIDLCCGWGGVLKFIKNRFPNITCIGVDIRKYAQWNEDGGVMFFNIPFEQIIESDRKADIVLMLNTYRRWVFGEELKKELYIWLKNHSKYFIASVDTMEELPKNSIHIGLDKFEAPLFIIETKHLGDSI